MQIETIQQCNTYSIQWCASQGHPSSTQKSLMCKPSQKASPKPITDDADQASELSSGLSLIWQSSPANHTAMQYIQKLMVHKPRQPIINPDITDVQAKASRQSSSHH
jgi:hypothetical protein